MTKFVPGYNDKFFEEEDDALDALFVGDEDDFEKEITMLELLEEEDELLTLLDEDDDF